MKKHPNTPKKTPAGKIISMRDYENEKENEAVAAARDYVEELIRANGGKMHTQSRIRTYKIGNEIMVRLDDVLALACTEKWKYRESIEPGYLSDSKEERLSAFLALNHFQVVLLSDELSKADNIDDHKRILKEHSGKRRKPVNVPGRYAVGKRDGHGGWVFIKAVRDDKTSYTVRPCLSFRFLAYTDASDCVNRLGDTGWEVVDMLEYLPRDKRLMRDIFAEDDWDEGSENAVRLSDC